MIFQYTAGLQGLIENLGWLRIHQRAAAGQKRDCDNRLTI
jgi:hypothetical protein